jgi:hypothetical protein
MEISQSTTKLTTSYENNPYDARKSFHFRYFVCGKKKKVKVNMNYRLATDSIEKQHFYCPLSSASSGLLIPMLFLRIQ